MECLAIYHTAFEDLGSFAAPLRERGYAIRYRHPGAEPPTPEDWLRPDLVAVLGGPIGVGDTAGYPWLRPELDGLRLRLAHARPTLGICLGAQLMAAALGGRVERRAGGPEIGWGALDFAGPDGVLASLADVPVLHWHGDNIVPASGMDVLAASAGTPCQAFAAGSHALGLQFHAEFDAARIEEWLSGHAVELAQAGIALDALRRDTARHGGGLAMAGTAMLARWLDALKPSAKNVQR
jgi:GMP synthase (glutamine-hydrolysing)